MSVIYTVVCGAEPAASVDTFVAAAREAGADCHIILTPAATAFVDSAALEQVTGNPVVDRHRAPGTPRRPRPDADVLVVAPATANTICKTAAGITDTYALDVISERISLRVPVLMVPFVDDVLARRAPYQRARLQLEEEGVTVVNMPRHGRNTGAGLSTGFPWTQVLEMALASAGRRRG